MAIVQSIRNDEKLATYSNACPRSRVMLQQRLEMENEQLSMRRSARTGHHDGYTTVNSPVTNRIRYEYALIDLRRGACPLRASRRVLAERSTGVAQANTNASPEGHIRRGCDSSDAQRRLVPSEDDMPQQVYETSSLGWVAGCGSRSGRRRKEACFDILMTAIKYRSPLLRDEGTVSLTLCRRRIPWYTAAEVWEDEAVKVPVHVDRLGSAIRLGRIGRR